MAQKEKLFEQFPPVSTGEWMEKIKTDLKGADFNKKLVWKTNEGISVNPFYRLEDTENLPFINTNPGSFPYIRGKKVSDNSWLVRQNIEVTDYSKANRKALNILMKGIDSLGFIIMDPESVSEHKFDLLLERIFLQGIEINFLSNGKAKEITDLFIKYVNKSFSDIAQIRGGFEADPLSRLMINGTLCIPPEQGFDYLAAVSETASVLPQFRTIHINASSFPNAGSDIVQELAFALAMGSEYMTQLIQRGITAEKAAARIRFSFGIGPEYFPEIAKLRAARLLWSAVMNAFLPGKAEEIKMDIHCVTSRWNKTIYDPYVNLLRTQTETMSAVLGGADSITTEPFDTVFRNPDEFSERIARNQQLLLREEAYFDKVADPAAGSYYIENMTNLIAESVWKLFVEIEDKGGFLECLNSGIIQNKLSESASKKEKDIATRKTILLGTNQYPNNLEKISGSVDLKKVFAGTTAVDKLPVKPIKFFRGSARFDKVRIAVDRSERRPVVFLLPLGNPVMSKARSQFSANFFACGGYRIIDNSNFRTVDEGVHKALEEKADIVVVCSSDDEYPVFAPDVFTRLNGEAIMVVAGNPACVEDLRSKGIENFIHLKSNLADTLDEFNKRLGIGQLSPVTTNNLS